MGKAKNQCFVHGFKGIEFYFKALGNKDLDLECDIWLTTLKDMKVYNTSVVELTRGVLLLLMLWNL